jgi:threonine dehydratase
VPGYDDVATIVAHARLWEAVGPTGFVYVPVGGGGLAASAALALGGSRVVAVQHAPALSLAVSLREACPVRVDPGDVPIAVRVPMVGRVPLALSLSLGLRAYVVDAEQVADALSLLHAAGVAAEPAGAIATAAALACGGGTALVSGGRPEDEG